jgi:hypothetical protein
LGCLLRGLPQEHFILSHHNPEHGIAFSSLTGKAGGFIRFNEMRHFQAHRNQSGE